jgi:hypothetical protein
MKHRHLALHALAIAVATFTLTTPAGAGAQHQPSSTPPCQVSDTQCPVVRAMSRHHHHSMDKPGPGHGAASHAGPPWREVELGTLKTQEDCVVFVRHRLARMKALAKERGMAVDPQPMRDPCVDLPRESR